jgi:hypothetical protein
VEKYLKGKASEAQLFDDRQNFIILIKKFKDLRAFLISKWSLI